MSSSEKPLLDETLSSYVARYLVHIRDVRRLSPHSVKAVEADIDYLANLLNVRFAQRFSVLLQYGVGLSLVLQLSFQDIRSLLGLASQQGASPASLARRISTWRVFFSWLSDVLTQKGGYQEEELNRIKRLCQGVKAPKKAQTLPKALSPDLAAVLLDQTKKMDGVVSTDKKTKPKNASQKEMFFHLRMCVILELLYGSGLRVSELASLDIQPVQFSDYESSAWLKLDENEVHVKGKGQQWRIVPVGRLAKEAVMTWLKEKNQWVDAQQITTLEHSDQFALLTSPKGKRLSVRLIQMEVAKAGRLANLPSRLHPHVLRHSFATHILQSSSDLRAVQELLGHRSIAATQVYTKLDFQQLAKVYDAAHPRANLKNRTNRAKEDE
jgi:integrase/recombinase XerC